MASATSLSLLERLRHTGDQEAWERFVKLYTPLLYHWAQSNGLQHQDARDLVQELLVLLARELPDSPAALPRHFGAGSELSRSTSGEKVRGAATVVSRPRTRLRTSWTRTT